MGFAERFPRLITLIIGVLVLGLSAAIVALEILSVYQDIGHGTIWAGLWSALIFIPTILALLIISKNPIKCTVRLKIFIFFSLSACCCRGRYCAFYVLLFVGKFGFVIDSHPISNFFSVASGLLACVIIYFAQAHMNNVCKCYLGDTVCCALKGVPDYQSNYQSILKTCESLVASNAQNIDTCNPNSTALTTKVVYLKAQLGCAVGLLVSCALYVLLFLFACFGVCFGHD